MRASRFASAVALALVTSGIAGGVVAGGAAADDHGVPSRQDVRHARQAVQAKAADVETVRARLVLANQRLQESATRADRAAEAFNGARYELQQARKQARDAQRRSAIAQADVDRQREVYGDAVVSSYEMAPGLTALSAIAHSDGIETVIDRATTVQNAESALDDRYDSFRAAATLADVATQQARDARAAAGAAAEKARAARDEARAAADRAAVEAQSIGQEKSRLIAQLADLQHISVRLAQRRQSALEAQAAAAAAAAAQHAAEVKAQQEAAAQAAQHAAEVKAQQLAQQQAQHAQQAHHHAAGSSGSHGSGGSSAPAPSTPSAPPAPPAPPSPPAPAGGADAAIAFAKAQLGEPYRWGAAGPDAWDCSGLTMGAWGAGGIALPHYSVAQYEQSTPISASDLRPGDLVFWGSSSDPSSIFHVALYLGGGQIIQAPRTGSDVTIESMYYWTPPNFFARP